MNAMHYTVRTTKAISISFDLVEREREREQTSDTGRETERERESEIVRESERESNYIHLIRSSGELSYPAKGPLYSQKIPQYV